jgi:hypothetical protein
VPDHDLTHLGSRAFEQLVVALACKELGPGVSVFGDGRDGGREATFEGQINWSATAAAANDQQVWNGFVVVQSKFIVKPKPEPKANAVWLQKVIAADIDRWIVAARRGSRQRLPDYLLFVTNADLSPVAKTGGIDAVNEFVAHKLDAGSTAYQAGLRVRGFRIWHADQIRSMLDAHQDVRWAFPALLTAGDVLAALGTDAVQLGEMSLQDPIREDLLRSLRDDRWIRLSQAGGPGDAKLLLDDIAIDVPGILDAAPPRDVRAARHVLDIGDMVLRPRQPDRVDRPNLVLVGGPGQGKTTLSQLIAQAYRTAMLADVDVDVGPDAKEIVSKTAAALERAGLFVPNNRRWPIRVDLAAYAEELAVGAETTLLRWVAGLVSSRGERKVHAHQLRTWLAAWPWALVLDGLDEVPSAESRRLLYQQIDALLATAEDIDADLLVVVTTRPTGYDERLPADRYEHIRLGYLTPDEAAAFSNRITDLRFTDDEEQGRRVAERMHAASRDPVVARLMQTPLQVTIVSLIVEKYPTLPPDRFTLFDRYYTTVTDREIAKRIGVARYIAEHRQRVDRLHEEVALRLQVASEAANGAEAVMSAAELGEIVTKQLVFRGFDLEAAAKDAAVLVEAAMKRLVLLTAREDGVGFEIRSLQELMAARALTEGTDDDVLTRLRLTARSPHWRNTWLLAVGSLLLRSERFEKHLVDLLAALDAEPDQLNDRYKSGPALAADILDDNLANGRPAFARALLRHVLIAVDRPSVADVDRIARTLNAQADDAVTRNVIFARLGSAASAGSRSRAAAALILDEMARHTTDSGRFTSITLRRQQWSLTSGEKQAVEHWLEVFRLGRSRKDMGAVDLADYLLASAAEIGLGDEGSTLLRKGLEPVRGSRFRPSQDDPDIALPLAITVGDPAPLLLALSDQDIVATLDLVLDALPQSRWAIEAMLGAIVRPALNRQAVGPRVAEHIAQTATRDAVPG